MLILTIRTDKPEAEIGLFEDHTNVGYETWHAHRELSATLPGKMLDVLASHKKSLKDLDGIVAFKGPGSFTGLRIGLAAANSLVYGQGIVGVATKGEKWTTDGIAQLLAGKTEPMLLPMYGGAAHITQQKK